MISEYPPAKLNGIEGEGFLEAHDDRGGESNSFRGFFRFQPDDAARIHGLFAGSELLAYEGLLHERGRSRLVRAMCFIVGDQTGDRIVRLRGRGTPEDLDE